MLGHQNKCTDKKIEEIKKNRERAEEWIEKAKNHEHFLPTRYYDHLSSEEMEKEYDKIAKYYQNAAHYLLLIQEATRTKDDYKMIQNCYPNAARTCSAQHPEFANAMKEHAKIFSMLSSLKENTITTPVSDKKPQNSVTVNSVFQSTKGKVSDISAAKEDTSQQLKR